MVTRTRASTVLALLLLAAPAWAAGTGQRGVQAQLSGQQRTDPLLLLVPADKASDFRQAVSQELQQRIVVSQPITVEGKQYRAVALPPSELSALHQAIGDKPYHDDVKLVVSFGQFMTTADLAKFEGPAGMQAQAPSAPSATPSREQTSAQAGAGSGASIPPGISIAPYESRAGEMARGRDQASASATTDGAAGQDAKQLRRDIATVQQIFPVEGGRLVHLQDGRTLFLPDSVRVVGGTLQKGAKVSGVYIQEDGRNVVTSLEVSRMGAVD